MIGNLTKLRVELKKLGSTDTAKASSWFFKTSEGQYGYGDKFIGVTVPEQHAIAKKYKDITLGDAEKLLQSEIHEERLTALFILVNKFNRKSDQNTQKDIFELYLRNLKHVNNWDLVDSSAHKIIGEYIKDKKITLLLALAKSTDLWERRISIISTFAFIANKDPKPSFLIADILLTDREDLIQKAVGWVLREVGKKFGNELLEEYLRLNYKKMGRTTLRYAIEKFTPEERKKYLEGKV